MQESVLKKFQIRNLTGIVAYLTNININASWCAAIMFLFKSLLTNIWNMQGNHFMNCHELL